MHDVNAIVGGAFRGLLDDLRDHYLQLQGLSPEERGQVVAGANAELATIEAAIADAKTENAVDCLLRFCFLTRFEIRDESEGRRHFIEQLAPRFPDQDAELEGWRWESPAWDVFLNGTRARLAGMDFYRRVQAVCNDSFGASLPSPKEDFAAWCSRAGLAEASRAALFDQQIREERASWFPSRKRIAFLEGEREKDRAQAARCRAEIESMFSELAKAKPWLEDLKRRELWQSGLCLSLNRVNDALNAGVSLKHLLLEEAHDMGQTFSALGKL